MPRFFVVSTISATEAAVETVLVDLLADVLGCSMVEELLVIIFWIFFIQCLFAYCIPPPLLLVLDSLDLKGHCSR